MATPNEPVCDWRHRSADKQRGHPEPRKCARARRAGKSTGPSGPDICARACRAGKSTASTASVIHRAQPVIHCGAATLSCAVGAYWPLSTKSEHRERTGHCGAATCPARLLPACLYVCRCVKRIQKYLRFIAFLRKDASQNKNFSFSN